MLMGGSRGRRPESLWKKTNHGYLMPAWRKTPAEAAVSRNQTTISCSTAAVSLIIDLLMKPEVSGKAEMESAPMMPQIVVTGMYWKSPPRSVHLRLFVAYSTAPADISKSAL